MWYVLYCPKTNEEAILQSCRENISSAVLKDAFLFTYERMKRYQGGWHLEKEKMFPDYIFLESDDSERLFQELEPYRLAAEPMESKQGKVLLPVEAEEEQLLQELCGDERNMSMSKGIIHQGITRVTEGPLKGKEHMISRIDRHKRLAFLKTPGFSAGAAFKAGLEITEKTM